LWQGGENVVVPDELIVDAPQDELPLRHGKPGDDVVGPEEQQLDMLVVRRRRWCFSVCHHVVGCVLCVGRSEEYHYLLGLNNMRALTRLTVVHVECSRISSHISPWIFSLLSLQIFSTQTRSPHVHEFGFNAHDASI
jgi:hypothetical protein